MEELVVNLHMHTVYSDGSGRHADLAAAALQAGVDVLLVSDHNVWVNGLDGYHRDGRRVCLLLAGEEIHDQDRVPQKNHLLVFGAQKELAPLADDPQALIDSVGAAGGVSFLAHPFDPALPAFDEGDISWVDWEARGFTGIELWNGFSELKAVIRNKFDGLLYAFFPELIARGPLSEALAVWDQLLTGGHKVVAVGGSDAHALHMSLGPVKKVIFPYQYHFSAINTHVLAPSGLTENLDSDRRIVLEALRAGNCFIGYDLACSTRGFRFSAQHRDGSTEMGEEVVLRGAINLQVKLPASAEVLLKKDGKTLRHTVGPALSMTVDQPGIYRVEAYRNLLGRRRGWIVSNPIYIR